MFFNKKVKDKCVSCGSTRLRRVNYGNSICYRPEVQCYKCGYMQPDTDKEEHKINPPKGGCNIKKGDR